MNGILEQTSIVTAVMIIVEVVKKATNDKYNRFLPLLALLLGIAGNVALNGVSAESIVLGVLIGGGACGIYDFGSKTIVGN